MLILNVKNFKKVLLEQHTKEVLMELVETSCVSFLCIALLFTFMFL